MAVDEVVGELMSESIDLEGVPGKPGVEVEWVALVSSRPVE